MVNLNALLDRISLRKSDVESRDVTVLTTVCEPITNATWQFDPKKYFQVWASETLSQNKQSYSNLPLLSWSIKFRRHFLVLNSKLLSQKLTANHHKSLRTKCGSLKTLNRNPSLPSPPSFQDHPKDKSAAPHFFARSASPFSRDLL